MHLRPASCMASWLQHDRSLPRAASDAACPRKALGGWKAKRALHAARCRTENGGSLLCAASWFLVGVVGWWRSSEGSQLGASILSVVSMLSGNHRGGADALGGSMCPGRGWGQKSACRDHPLPLSSASSQDSRGTRKRGDSGFNMHSICAVPIRTRLHARRMPDVNVQFIKNTLLKNTYPHASMRMLQVL